MPGCTSVLLRGELAAPLILVHARPRRAAGPLRTVLPPDQRAGHDRRFAAADELHGLVHRIQNAAVATGVAARLRAHQTALLLLIDVCGDDLGHCPLPPVAV